MYLEEKIIDGVLCYRTSPNDEFKQYTVEQISQKVIQERSARQSAEEKAERELKLEHAALVEITGVAEELRGVVEAVKEWLRNTGHHECTCSPEYVAIGRTDPQCGYCDEYDDRQILDGILSTAPPYQCPDCADLKHEIEARTVLNDTLEEHMDELVALWKRENNGETAPVELLGWAAKRLRELESRLAAFKKWADGEGPAGIDFDADFTCPGCEANKEDEDV